MLPERGNQLIQRIAVKRVHSLRPIQAQPEDLRATVDDHVSHLVKVGSTPIWSHIGKPGLRVIVGRVNHGTGASVPQSVARRAVL